MISASQKATGPSTPAVFPPKLSNATAERPTIRQNRSRQPSQSGQIGNPAARVTSKTSFTVREAKNPG
jgi:hypothetical protein